MGSILRFYKVAFGSFRIMSLQHPNKSGKRNFLMELLDLDHQSESMHGLPIPTHYGRADGPLLVVAPVTNNDLKSLAE